MFSRHPEAMRRTGREKSKKIALVRFPSNNRGVIDGIMLTEKTKEELSEIILQKDKQVDALVRKLEEKVKAEQKEANGEEGGQSQKGTNLPFLTYRPSHYP